MTAITQRSGDPVYDSFIRRSLGSLLPDCIKQLSESRPADPIEFISNALYKAVDSELYRREKEKYLEDCLRESALLQKEREQRKARMDMLLQAQRDNKELLRKAREDELKALTDLAMNAELYGIQLSPRSMQRINAIKREAEEDLKAERTLQITMPQKPAKTRGKWVEVEEQMVTDSGTVITVKTRKRVPVEDDDETAEPGKMRGKKGGKLDQSSVFGEEGPGSIASVGTVTLTDRGIFTFMSGAIGMVEPPDPLNRQLAPADNPDIWANQRFDCHTLYDHELYIRCDAEDAGNVNQHASPPRKLVREYLDSVSSALSSEEEKSRAPYHRDKSRRSKTKKDVSRLSGIGSTRQEEHLEHRASVLDEKPEERGSGTELKDVEAES